MHDWEWYTWGMPMMWIVWIPVIILVVWLIVKLTNGTWQQQSRGESPMDILKKRYASGEITKEEYEQKKKVLEK